MSGEKVLVGKTSITIVKSTVKKIKILKLLSLAEHGGVYRAVNEILRGFVAVISSLNSQQEIAF